MLLGIDVSKWQREMNWSKARSAGARFAFVRAGSCTLVGGNSYTDYQFERNAELAPEYMPIGFYWYFRPQHQPEEQANYLCSLIKDKKRKLPVVIDLEHAGDLSPEDVTISAGMMAKQIYQRIGEWPLLYSRALWLNENTITSTVWTMMRLWIARYKSSLTAPWSDGKCIPRDFKEWDFWQYSADNNGRGAEFGAKSKSIDLNRFNGDEAKFRKYYGPGTPRLIRINSQVAKVGSGPEGEAIGVTWKGRTWPLVGVSPDGKYFKVEGWIKKENAEHVKE